MDNTFIRELYETSETNFKLRKVFRQERELNDTLLGECISKLTDEIINGCKERMRAASLEGKYQATLYEFTNQDMYEDYKTIFLMKGPIPGCLAYFEHKGIPPILQSVCTYLSPLPVFIKYDHHHRSYLVIVSWKNT